MWQIGTMSRKERSILIKAGYEVRDIDEKAFNKLVDPNWKSKGFKSDIDKDDVLACVYVDVNIFDDLNKAIEFEKSHGNMKKDEKLRYDREFVADNLFGLFGLANTERLNIPEDSTVVDHEGWENNGEDSLIKTFYYSAPNVTDDSLIGSFIVNFKKNSKIAIDFYGNT